MKSQKFGLCDCIYNDNVLNATSALEIQLMMMLIATLLVINVIIIAVITCI